MVKRSSQEEIVPATCPMARSPRVLRGFSRPGGQDHSPAASLMSRISALIPKLTVSSAGPMPSRSHTRGVCAGQPHCCTPTAVWTHNPPFVDSSLTRSPRPAADDPLADGVRPGCLRRAGENPDAIRLEHGVEGIGELTRSIPDQELDGSRALAEAIRKLRAACVVHAPSGCAVMPTR